jgi:putative transcriptional regulator
MRNRLRVLRAEHGWTQDRLAGEVGVSRQTINSIETGRFDPSLRLAFALARLFACRIEDIFAPGADGRTGHVSPGTDAP